MFSLSTAKAVEQPDKLFTAMKRTSEDRTDIPVERDGGSTRLNRIIIRLDTDGKPDWDAMSDQSKVDLCSAFEKDPDAARNLGLVSGDSPSGDGAFSTEQAKVVLSSLSNVNMFIGMRLAAQKNMQLEPDVAAMIPFNDDQKEQMAPLLASTANRVVPAQAKPYVDMILLGSMLVTYSAQNIFSALGTQAVRNFNVSRMSKPDMDARRPAGPVGVVERPTGTNP